MSKDVEYIRILTLEDQIRVSFTTDKRRVAKFIIQFESFIKGKWTPIIRYDTAHGFAHCDEIFPDGTTKKMGLGITNWGQALNFAINDLNQNWQKYKNRYVHRMKKP